MFCRKFRTQIEHSTTTLTHREVFNALDADYNKQVNNEEMKAFRALVPPPAMPRASFLEKFSRPSAAGVFNKEVIERAFDYLDQDGNGHLGGEGETAAIVATLQRYVHAQSQPQLDPGCFGEIGCA